MKCDFFIGIFEKIRPTYDKIVNAKWSKSGICENQNGSSPGFCKCIPHTRGGDPMNEIRLLGRLVYSPHTWG